MPSQIWEILDTGTLYRHVLKNLQGKFPINMVELFVSDHCPLKCKHCFHADVRSVDPPLSLQEWQAVIEQFVDQGVRHFHLAGREPFTEHITLELLAYFSKMKEKLNLKIGAISNGLNCQKYLDEIQRSNLDYLDISVDGLESTHDFVRGKGTYKRVFQNLKEIILALGSNRISTATALHKANIHQIPEIIHTLSQLGIRRFFFQPVVPMGYALTLTDLLLEGREYGRAISETKKILAQAEYQSPGIVVKFYVPPEIVRSLCLEDPSLEVALLDFLLQGQSVLTQGSSYLELDFNLTHIPFWQHCIVTEDGYIINDCYSRSVPNYVDNSLGSVRQFSIQELLCNARQLAINYLASILNSTTNQVSIVGSTPIPRENLLVEVDSIYVDDNAPNSKGLFGEPAGDGLTLYLGGGGSGGTAGGSAGSKGLFVELKPKGLDT
jgi:MoaA/NifB/PqqE/SkfB family radical SAM enzyme